SDANDGELTRDEDFAELVARIRGSRTASSDPGRSTAPIASTTPIESSPLLSVKGPGRTDERRSDDAPSSETDVKAAKSASQTRDRSAPDNRNEVHPSSPHGGRAPAPPPCVKEPVEIIRGPEVDRFELTKCDGTVAPLAVEHLSILIRPGGAERPVAPLPELAKKAGQEIAHGIRRVDPRLVERIQALVDHFSKPTAPAKLFIISGYRPASVGSMHSTGRAIDFRIEGVKNEDVVAFCKTLGDTGCGYYPNSSFVHVDV